ncbi:MAG: hypothetical protein ABEN55_08860 [Bradymonadaceae bacterium]
MASPPNRVHAQEASDSATNSSSDSEVAEAQKHFDRGAEYYVDEKFSKAIVEFRKAQNLHPHPLFLYNIVRAYVRIGQCSNALEYARKLESADKLKSETRAKLQASVRACRRVQTGVALAPRLVRKNATEKKRTDSSTGAEEESKPTESSEDEAEKRAKKQKESTPATRTPDETAKKSRKGDEPAETPSTSEPASGKPANDTEPERESPETAGTAEPAPTPTGVTALRIGTLSVGGALLAGGLLHDRLTTAGRYRQVSSAENLDAARRQQLAAEAKRARTRTIGLWVAGGILTAGGVVLSIADLSPKTDDASTTALRIVALPRRIGLEIAW